MNVNNKLKDMKITFQRRLSDNAISDREIVLFELFSCISVVIGCSPNGPKTFHLLYYLL